MHVCYWTHQASPPCHIHAQVYLHSLATAPATAELSRRHTRTSASNSPGYDLGLIEFPSGCSTLPRQQPLKSVAPSCLSPHLAQFIYPSITHPLHSSQLYSQDTGAAALECCNDCAAHNSELIIIINSHGH